jgi:hypothetical protein
VPEGYRQYIELIGCRLASIDASSVFVRPAH